MSFFHSLILIHLRYFLFAPTRGWSEVLPSESLNEFTPKSQYLSSSCTKMKSNGHLSYPFHSPKYIYGIMKKKNVSSTLTFFSVHYSFSFLLFIILQISSAKIPQTLASISLISDSLP